MGLRNFFNFLLGRDGPGADDDSIFSINGAQWSDRPNSPFEAKLPPPPEALGLPPERVELVFIPKVGWVYNYKHPPKGKQ